MTSTCESITGHASRQISRPGPLRGTAAARSAFLPAAAAAARVAEGSDGPPSGSPSSSISSSTSWVAAGASPGLPGMERAA